MNFSYQSKTTQYITIVFFETVFSYFALLIECYDTKYFRDQKVKITLCGYLALSLSEYVIGKHTVVIVASTMVEGLQD